MMRVGAEMLVVPDIWLTLHDQGWVRKGDGGVMRFCDYIGH